MSMSDEPNKLEQNWRNPDGTLKAGHPNFGAGRPKGKTLKEFAREFLMSMDDDKKLEFLNSLAKDIVWRMAEGNPHNTEDLTSGGKPLPTPIYALPGDNSIKEDSPVKETD